MKRRVSGSHLWIVLLSACVWSGCGFNIDVNSEEVDLCADVVCSDNAKCVAGVCQCKEGYLDCSDASCMSDDCKICVAKNDINHCGVCGNACAVEDKLKNVVAPACVETASDTGFMCDYTCKDSELNYCKDQANPCVNFKTDKYNCGGCGLQCISSNSMVEDTTCVDGQCIYRCSEGNFLCGDKCVDLSSDTTNCGACGNKCAPGETCFDGSCAFVCESNIDCEKLCKDSKGLNQCKVGYSGDYIPNDMKCNSDNHHCMFFDDTHEFVKLKGLPSGEYRLEVWGASGGEMEVNSSGLSQGGLGGYSTGNLTWKGANLINKELYINIGKIGKECLGTNFQYTSCGGNNGGGSGYYSEKLSGYGGGGATDIRIDGYTLYHRVIVAGGGGGADVYTQDDSDGSGGYGGGEVAGNGLCAGNASADIAGADQKGDEALFGKGENVVDAWKAVGGTGTGSWKAIGGGGGGWYGGRAANDDNCGGAGGSGFVFTSLDQKAVSDLNGKYMLGEKYLLKNARTVGGKDEFPSTDGKMERGHKGNGAVRITLLKAY